MGTFKKDKALTRQEVFGPGQTNSTAGSNNQRIEINDTLRQFAGTVYSVVKRTCDKVTSTKLRLYTTAKGPKVKGYRLGNWERKKLIARSKTMIHSGDDVQEVASHPAIDLICKRPNPFFSGWKSSYLAQLYLELCGIVYYRVEFAKDTRIPIEYYVVPPQVVKPQLNKDGTVKSYKLTLAGGEEEVPPEEILVQKSLNLFQPYGVGPGTSGVMATMSSLQLQERITNTLLAILKNEGRPSAILSPKGEYSDIDEVEADRWRNKYRQFLNNGSGDVMVLDSEATYTPLTYKPTDLAVIQIAKQNEEEITKTWGMPIMVLRGTEGGSRAAYQTALQEWIDGAISFRLRDNEDYLNHCVLPIWEEQAEGYFFAYDDPSPTIEELNKDLAIGYAGGPVLTVNEARSIYLGMEPIDGGDDLRGLDPEEEAEAEGETPIDEQPVDPAAVADPLAATSQDLQTSPQLTLNGSQIESAMAIVDKVANELLPRESGIGALQVLLNLSPEQAELIMGAVGRTFFVEAPAAPPGPGTQPPEQSAPDEAQAPPDGTGDDTGKEASDLETKAHKGRGKPGDGKELIPILQKHFARWRGTVLSSVKEIPNLETKALPRQFVPLDKWSADLADECRPLIELMMEDEGKKLLSRVGASPDAFHVFNSKVKEKAEKASLDLAESTLETTTKDIDEALAATREAMAEGLEEGESIADLTKRIGEIFDGAEGYRAERIAKTEASNAWHEGLRESAKASGVVTGFTWESSSDPCPECQNLDGTDLDLDASLPPAHPNCECTVLERLDESIDNQEEE